MNDELDDLLVDAKDWLSGQPIADNGSTRWYAMGNFRTFVEAIERDRSAQSIEKAVYSLRHHVTDQFDWSADYCKMISEFCARVDRIGKRAKNV